MNDETDQQNTARVVSFRCPTDLEAQLTRAAADLGVSVSRAIDGLLRDGIDTRAASQRDARIAQRLESAISRLEFLTQRASGRNQFDDESTVVGFALLELERGERNLTGLLSAEVFAEPVHRSTWKTIGFLLGENARERKANVPQLLAGMHQDESAAAVVAAVTGSLQAYFELIMKRARWLESEPIRGRAIAADAIRGVVGEALHRMVQPDGEHVAEFAQARRISLFNLVNGPLAVGSKFKFLATGSLAETLKGHSRKRSVKNLKKPKQ